jgi:hypothetical protein
MESVEHSSQVFGWADFCGWLSCMGMQMIAGLLLVTSIEMQIVLQMERSDVLTGRGDMKSMKTHFLV